MRLELPSQSQDQSNCGEHAAENPEAHNDGGLVPAELFEVVVDWGDEEDFAAEEFFGGELNDDGEGFDDEDESDHDEGNGGVGHHGDHAEG